MLGFIHSTAGLTPEHSCGTFEVPLKNDWNAPPVRPLYREIAIYVMHVCAVALGRAVSICNNASTGEADLQTCQRTLNFLQFHS